MKEVTETYYLSKDGKKFKDKSECKEYEEAILKASTLQERIKTLNKELACVQYILYGKGTHVPSVSSAGGCGHDGYYNECPYCGELVGGYEGRNTSLKVAECVYKCEKCGEFFRYS